MGLFDRKKQVANSAVNPCPEVVGDFRFVFGGKRYADAYLWMVLKRVFQGMRNVAFTVDSRRDPLQLTKVYNIAEFLEKNFHNMMWLYWSYGYIVVGTDAKGRFYIPQYNTLRKDANRNIIGDYVVYYSETYKFDGKSDFAILKQNIDNLDTVKNGQDYLTRSLGALGILSNKGMPLLQQDKDEFNDKMRKKYGIREEQYQIMLFDSDVNFQQMSLPIKDLALDERIKDEIKLIAGYFGVPYDLIPFAGASTYANQEQAVKTFYSDCISNLAEIALAVGRQIIKDDAKVLIPSSVLTFRIDNVAELKDDRTSQIEYKLKVADLVAKMKAAGLDYSQYEQELTEKQ